MDLVFLDTTYDDTMALLVEARNYAAYRQADEVQSLEPGTRLQASYESLRVTARLTEVMAWALLRKAVAAGEITHAESINDDTAITQVAVCADPSGSENPELPGGLRSLLERSHRLYQRVARLDRMMRATA